MAMLYLETNRNTNTQIIWKFRDENIPAFAGISAFMESKFLHFFIYFQPICDAFSTDLHTFSGLLPSDQFSFPISYTHEVDHKRVNTSLCQKDQNTRSRVIWVKL